jgi:hypothetical protein
VSVELAFVHDGHVCLVVWGVATAVRLDREVRVVLDLYVLSADEQAVQAFRQMRLQKGYSGVIGNGYFFLVFSSC